MSVDRLKETIDLFFSGHELAQLSAFNITDAFAVIYLQDRHTKALTKLMTTEIIRDDRNPKWITVLTMDYHFEILQHLVIRVYQEEGNKPTTHENVHTLIGETSFLLSEVMRKNCLSLTLKNAERSGVALGKIQVRTESKVHCRDLFCVTFSCQNLVNKEGFFNISDPYLVISRINQDDSWSPVWKSEHIDNNLNPIWPPVTIAMGVLCNGDANRRLRIEVIDHNEHIGDVSMGYVETTPMAMVDADGMPFAIIEPSKKDTPGYINSGTLICSHCVIEELPSTFSDFVCGGYELSMIVGIDFTGSNGTPKFKACLHYIDPDGVVANQYEQAIVSVGTIVEAYDDDRKFPVYGFGACLPKDDTSGTFGDVNHCFSLHGEIEEVLGVNGILKAYTENVSKVKFSGPTKFAPLIRHVLDHTVKVNEAASKIKYSVLLILTDGVIDDMDDTKSVIIEASNHPLSIIIIGVGKANFDKMHVLDGDHQALLHNGKTADRDIVQFVAFRDFESKGIDELAKEVLAEIPQQVVEFFQKHGVKPE